MKMGYLDANGFEWSGPALADLGERVSIMANHSFSVLNISNVEEEDAGIYECRHPLSSNSAVFSLMVQGKAIY